MTPLAEIERLRAQIADRDKTIVRLLEERDEARMELSAAVGLNAIAQQEIKALEKEVADAGDVDEAHRILSAMAIANGEISERIEDVRDLVIAAEDSQRMADVLQGKVESRDAEIERLRALLEASDARANALHRRAQRAESLIAQSGIVEGRPQGDAGRSLGRALANYAAALYRRERDEAHDSIRLAMREGLDQCDRHRALYASLLDIAGELSAALDERKP